MLPRTLFYALVAINIVLAVLLALPFFGVAPTWSAAAEPERIAKQLAPDSIRVLPPHAEQSAAPLVLTETSAASAAASVPSGGGVAETPTAVEVEESRCIAYKGLSDDAASQLLEQVKKSRGEIKVKQSEVTSSSYWVHIPPDGGKEAAERRVEVLQRNGISDFFIVRESGSNQYAVSLGLYRAEELAKRRLEALQKVGIKTATITTRENASQRVELSGLQTALDKVVIEFGRTNKNKPLQREKCEGG